MTVPMTRRNMLRFCGRAYYIMQLDLNQRQAAAALAAKLTGEDGDDAIIDSFFDERSPCLFDRRVLSAAYRMHAKFQADKVKLAQYASYIAERSALLSGRASCRADWCGRAYT